MGLPGNTKQIPSAYSGCLRRLPKLLQETDAPVADAPVAAVVAAPSGSVSAKALCSWLGRFATGAQRKRRTDHRQGRRQQRSDCRQGPPRPRQTRAGRRQTCAGRRQRIVCDLPSFSATCTSLSALQQS